jgi:hypothetical protein
MKLLDFDENSPKIFQFLFNTDKIIKLYAITGSDDNKIDEMYEKLAPNTLYTPQLNNTFPHNNIENYFSSFKPDCRILNEKNELVDRMSRLIFWMPESGMNIREQQEFVKTLVQHVIDFDINQKEFEIVIVTHSLFILSDIPSGNVNVFNKEKCDGDKMFFAGNLYNMLANLSPDIAMGRLAADYSSKLIKMANDFAAGISNEMPDETLVNLIGDNIIKGYIKNRTQC